MRTSLFAVVFALLLALTAPALATSGGNLTQAETTTAACTFPHSATDATGENVTIDSRPGSVVALQPSDAQTMWYIGAKDQVTALPQTQYTNYLSDRGNRTNVKNEDGTVNAEVVTDADPDLVLAANATNVDTVQSLRQAGLTVYHFDQATSLDDIMAQVQNVGRLTGNCEGATETVTSMQATIDEVETAVADRERPDVLYYFFEYTAGEATHIDELIETAGGTNIAAEGGLRGYKPVSTEFVVANNPDWIVYPTHAAAPSGAPYNETTAIQENQTLKINADYVSQPAPLVVDALRTMAETFHPEAFETANGTASPDSTTVTTADGPGFGVVIATLALLLATLLAVRRE
jgi:iron complex transport system substrate-binding protein